MIVLYKENNDPIFPMETWVIFLINIIPFK